MTEEKPIVYILRGDDREAVEAHIRTFRSSLGAPDMAEMNFTRLEGKSISLNDLRSAALAMPFLTERRLVVVEDALKSFGGRDKEGDRAALIALMDSLPQSTALVLIISDSQNYRKEWDTLRDTHWLIKWVKEVGSRAYIVDCPLPQEREMASWARQKSVELGGSLTPQAAETLAQFIGNDTQQAAQEIVKLLTFVNFERPVDADDVLHLVSRDYQSDVFSLVDAIGTRDGKKAQEMLHLLLEENEVIQLFGMIIRQFRLILQAREIIDAGGNEQDVAKNLHQRSFVARKISAQTRRFDLAALEAIYHQLLKIDVDMKTGEMSGDIALDILIARLAI